jgi:predicted transport protein
MTKIQEIYGELRRQILALGSDIEVRATKKYIGFRRNQQFAGTVFLKEKIKVYLNIEPSRLVDPLKLARNVKDIGHYSHGDSEVFIHFHSSCSASLDKASIRN